MDKIKKCVRFVNSHKIYNPMKKILLSISCFLILFSATAQENTLVEPEFNPEISSSVTFGTGIVSYLHSSPKYYQYVAPEFKYQLNPRISINAGIMVMSGNYFSASNDDVGNSRNLNTLVLYLWVLVTKFQRN